MIELVKKGKRTHGAYFTLASGKKVYCAFKTPGAFSLNTKPGVLKSVAEGLEDGSAAWAIDEAQLRQAKSRGVTLIAIWVKKLDWLWMTSIEAFFDPHKYSRRNGASGGKDQRHLGCEHWQKLSREAVIGPLSIPE